MLNRINKKFLLFTIWAITTYLIYLYFHEIKLEYAWEEVKGSQPLWLMLGIIGHFLIFILWAKQWILFLPNNIKVTFKQMFEINALMSTAMNTLPFPGGHAFGIFLLGKKEQVGHSAALSVMSLDQLAEGLAKLSVLLIVALIAPIPPIMQQGILALILIILLFLCILLYSAYRFRNYKSSNFSHYKTRKEKIIDFVSRWGRQLEGLRNLKIFIYGITLAYGMKLCEASAIWGVQKSFGLDLPIWSVLLILATLNLTTIIPITPGNLGVYEATVFFIYQYLGIIPEKALALAIIQHICFLLPLAGTGYIYILLKNIMPKTPFQKKNTPNPKHTLENERV